MRCLLVLLIAAPLAYAGDVWVFVKGGTVGLGDPTRDPITLTLADGSTKTVAKDEIQFQRTREQVDQGVAQMVQDISRGQKIEEHSKRFVVLRAAAVPKLLEFLNKPEPMLRMGALLGLQYAWAPQAEAPVFKLLDDADFDIRAGACQVLALHIPEASLAERLRPMADAADLPTAVLAFELVDKHYPDASLKRIQRILRDPTHRASATPRLSHYLSPALTDDTCTLLIGADPGMRRAAVVGLISQLASGDTVRAKVRALLADASADLREIAAEYFTWLGQRDDLPALREALGSENDPYARAAFDAAVKTIESRAALWAKTPALAGELEKLRQADAVEPALVYEVREHEQKQHFRERAFRLQDLLAAPSGSLSASRRFNDSEESKPATTWLPPVRDYFDPRRKSFGFAMTQDATPFAGSVHIGDDAAWSKDLRTVVAVAPGVVRSASHIFSWGFIVVIEHKRANGEPVCSLYAHLSPMLHVKPGDIVAAGQKIGSVGRSHSVENGGYNAHIHFGLHSGSYEGGSWTCGYISPQTWAGGQHGWLDPQAFLKTNALR